MTVHIGFVLDMSGSMAAIHDATIRGTTEYLETLQKDHPEARLTLSIFDDVIEEWVVDKPLSEVKVQKLMGKYQPRNMTALLDAVGTTIQTLKKASKEKVTPGEELENKVIFVVMTDGHENSSRKFTRKQIAESVRKLTKRGNWTFVYLGANVDAWTEAAGLGFAVGNTMAYSSSAGSTQSAFLNTARATGQRISSPQAQTTTFYEDADEEQDVRDEDDPTKVVTPAP